MKLGTLRVNSAWLWFGLDNQSIHNQVTNDNGKQKSLQHPDTHIYIYICFCFWRLTGPVCSKCSLHRENSPVTQTSPEPTLLSWGGGPLQKKFPPPLATWQARSYRANWATQTLLFSKPLDLAQVCHKNKICSKPALTWKLTWILAFPAHCISNKNLNGISRTNISKVTLNAASEHSLSFRCTTDPLLGQEVGEKCAVGHESMVWKSSAWSPYDVMEMRHFPTHEFGLWW